MFVIFIPSTTFPNLTMSHHASPIQSAGHQRQHQSVIDHPQDSETFDIFADVSHHGSSLAEFLSMPSTLENNFTSNIDSDTRSQPTSLSRPNLSFSPPTPSHPSSSASQQVDLSSPFNHSVQNFYSQLSTHSPKNSPTSAPSTTPFNHVQSSYTRSTTIPTTNVPSSQNIHTKSSNQTPTKSQSNPQKKRLNSKTRSNNSRIQTPSDDSNIKLTKSSKNSSKVRTASQAQLSSASAGTTRKKTRSTPTSKLSKDIVNDSEASEESDDLAGSITSKRPGPNSRTQSQQLSKDTHSATDGQNKDTHNSHTRRCRAKVNSKFQELLQILPAPPPKTGIKHKAQILDYTIQVFRDMHAKKTMLEVELALSSRTQLNTWVENVVRRSISLQDALAPYLSLVCTKGRWKYSEAWVPVQEPSKNPNVTDGVQGISGESQIFTPLSFPTGPHSKLRLGCAVVPSLGNTDDPDLQMKLEKFREKSRPYGCKARVDLPGRIMCTMRPEWLPSLEDDEAFQRARLAKEASLVVCFGVPVFVRGHVAAVAVFFDTEQRPYDAKCVDLADNVAILLGNSFGAAALKKADQM